MDLSGLINRFATGTYVVTRRGATTTGSDGRGTDAASSTFSVQACVQPLSGRELQRLTQGLRASEVRKLYTTSVLKAIDAPDVVTIDGADWQVEDDEDYSAGGYYKYTVRKVGN